LARVIPGYTFLTQHSHLLALIRGISTHGLGRTPAPDVPIDLAPSLPMLQLTASEVRRLAGTAREMDARLVVAYVPGKELVYSTPGPNHAAPTIQESLREVSAAEGVRFLDATTVLRRRAQEPAPLYYSGSDSHPTRRGYDALAWAVATAIMGDFPERSEGASKDPRCGLDVPR
jgi:hypothetical protein